MLYSWCYANVNARVDVKVLPSPFEDWFAPAAWYVDVGDGICACVVDVGDDVKVLPPLLRIDSRQQDPMENLSKLVKGQGRVHQKANGGEPTYLFTKEASPVQYIDMTYRLSIYRHFWKISISISITIRQFWKISISIRQFQKYRYR